MENLIKTLAENLAYIYKRHVIPSEFGVNTVEHNGNTILISTDYSNLVFNLEGTNLDPPVTFIISKRRNADTNAIARIEVKETLLYSLPMTRSMVSMVEAIEKSNSCKTERNSKIKIAY